MVNPRALEPASKRAAERRASPGEVLRAYARFVLQVRASRISDGNVRPQLVHDFCERYVHRRFSYPHPVPVPGLDGRTGDPQAHAWWSAAVHRTAAIMHIAIHRRAAVDSQSQPMARIFVAPPEVAYLRQEGRAMSTTFSQRDDGVSDSWDGPIDIAAAVAEFHMAFNLPTRQLPSAEIDHGLARLRVALLEEEVGEFVAASGKGDLVGIADALADIVYVIYGTALTYGIDLDTVLREVHRSNMSKLRSDGKPLIRDDGKVLKSENYFPPDIESVLSLQSR